MSDSGSVSFDRAASYYDQTRIFPPEITAAMPAVLEQEFTGLGGIVEIGVGTGRFALPLASAGIDVTGVDISIGMIEQLLSKASGSARPHLALADATQMPFADDSFGGGLVVHVFHLIENWADAARELARVVRPGGRIIVDLGSADPNRPGGWRGMARELEDRFRTESGVTRRHPGIENIADLDAVLGEAGAVGRDLDPIVGTMQIAPGILIKTFELGAWQWTWQIPEETRARVAASITRWAEAEYGELDSPRDLEVVVSFRAYDLP